MRQLKVKIKGLAPMLMHSDRFSNPLDKATKAHKLLTSKKDKTDDDHEAILKSEWLGSIYYSNDIGPFIPAQNIDKCLKEASTIQKLGKKFPQAVMVIEDRVPLQYKGPREVQALFATGLFTDVRGIKVSQSRIMRCRPKFNQWSCEFTIGYDEEIVDVEKVTKAIHDAGKLIGLGDFRPRYGRFMAQIDLAPALRGVQ